MRTAAGVLAASLLIVSGCHRQASFSELAEQFTYESLALSPVGATAAGYHLHHGLPLDQMLDDLSPAGLDQQRKFYRTFEERLRNEVKPDQLSAEDRADYGLIRNQISLALLDLDTIQSYRHNPTEYVELIGNALFTPFQNQYGPLSDRYGHIMARLREIPRLLQQAQQNLESAPKVWVDVAASENDGNIELIDRTLRTGVPAAQKIEYDRAAGPALDALRQFNGFLRDTLAKHDSPWQLGEDKYNRKFQYTLQTDRTPAQVLASAEAAWQDVQAQMLKLAQQIDGPKATVAGTLEKIARQHGAREEYFRDAKKDLADARAFVKEKNVVPLPVRSNLEVIETPKFMRGIYGVGGFSQAPALEPQLGAYYWITPLSEDAAKAESTLREYNRYGLEILTIHEAMPGHYVQFEYANDIQPKVRRLLRALYGSGPYVEGWAVYVTEVMINDGYMNNDPALRLTFLKHQLRVLANAIMDIRFHTRGMTDEQALDLMKRGYQEQAEATAKLQRAKLSSCQLPMYWVGYSDWVRMRKKYEQSNGGPFRETEFHERALKEGALPLSVLSRVLLGQDL